MGMRDERAPTDDADSEHDWHCYREMCRCVKCGEVVWGNELASERCQGASAARTVPDYTRTSHLLGRG